MVKFCLEYSSLDMHLEYIYGMKLFHVSDSKHEWVRIPILVRLMLMVVIWKYLIGIMFLSVGCYSSIPTIRVSCDV